MGWCQSGEGGHVREPGCWQAIGSGLGEAPLVAARTLSKEVGWGGCPRKMGPPQEHPRYPHVLCLTVESPGWGHSSTETYSSSVECGCWFSYLDFAGILSIMSPYYCHHHLHTCIKKTCLFPEAITFSEQMSTPLHLLPVTLSVLCQGGASSGLGAPGTGPEDPHPPSCRWPDLPWL